MGRLRPETLRRSVVLAHGVVDVAESLVEQHRSFRIVNQLTDCGTSIAANLHEADEAMSRADFVRILSVVLKETRELQFWLGFIQERQWVEKDRLAPLLQEAEEFRLMLRAMIIRTKGANAD
jgi:four helix bundle protein